MFEIQAIQNAVPHRAQTAASWEARADCTCLYQGETESDTRQTTLQEPLGSPPGEALRCLVLGSSIYAHFSGLLSPRQPFALGAHSPALLASSGRKPTVFFIKLPSPFCLLIPPLPEVTNTRSLWDSRDTKTKRIYSAPHYCLLCCWY